MLRTAAEAQKRARDADALSAGVVVGLSGGTTPARARDVAAPSARESVERAAAAVYTRALEAGGVAAGSAAARMAEIADIAESLAANSGSLEDREAGKRVLRGISESVDRLKASYEEDASMAREYAGDAVRGYAESALARKEVLERRAAELLRAREFLEGAIGALTERFMAEAERRGARDVVERARRALDFGSYLEARVGGVPQYASDLAEPISDLETRLARRASVPGLYEQLESDVAGVPPRENIDTLRARVDSLE